MVIETLKEFITLAEKLNFSQTAHAHYITQPVLTKHIQQLENELGTTLFFRDRQSVQLTPMGELFLPDAMSIVSTYNNARRKIDMAQKGFSSSFVIAFLDAAIREQLPVWIQEFSAEYPNVQIDCTSTNILGAAEQLRNRDCDLAVTLQMPQLDYPDFNSRLLYRDPVCLFVPQSHRFAECSSIRLEDLSSETFIMASSDFVKDYRIFLEQVFKKSRVKIASSRFVSSVEQAFMLVNAGVGVLLAPSHQRLFSGSNIREIPIDEEDLYVNVVLMWLKSNANPNVANFVRMVDEME